MDYPSKATEMSDAQLLDYSGEHLKHEIAMFFNTGVLLFEELFSTASARDETCKNALVESFAIHFRNLVLFLYNAGEEPDIISDYYFIDHRADWRRKRHKKSPLLEEAHDRASREISHLTVFRRKIDKDWPVRKLMEEIKDVLQVFVDNASDTKLHESVKKLVHSIELPSSRPVPTDTRSVFPEVIKFTDVSTTSQHNLVRYRS
jgi:hypothetical protein